MPNNGASAKSLNRQGKPPSNPTSVRAAIELRLCSSKDPGCLRILALPEPCCNANGHKTYLTMAETNNENEAEISQDNTAVRKSQGDIACGSLSVAPDEDVSAMMRVTIPAKTKATPSKVKHHMVNEESVIQPERKFPSGSLFRILPPSRNQ
jgi:hypothetical protein